MGLMRGWLQLIRTCMVRVILVSLLMFAAILLRSADLEDIVALETKELGAWWGSRVRKRQLGRLDSYVRKIAIDEKDLILFFWE
ncbi:hypothetical protein F4814DRAFT_414950 [Daldinia grandis]|nr:hypothetical protein F4814DRAFT_414950 [Daldinia grandis]